MSTLTVRAAAHPQERSRSLICTSDAIWFWPGVPLSYQRGGKVHPIARDAIRTCAYPFYERTFRYEALLEAAMRYSALNQAQQYSTPILMLLAGRRDRWGEFTDLCLSHMSGTIEEDYRRYLAALEPYLRQKGLLPS